MTDRDDLILAGEPGTRWSNGTGLVLYQLTCSFQNSCGWCIGLHHAISSGFALPFHRRCRCTQEILIPGAIALPWVDYRKIFARLPAAKRRTAVGKSVDILIQKGILTLEEAVLPGRPKSLEEIAAEKGLSAEDMIRAGVDPEIARRAADHPAIDHEAAHRERMRQRIAGAIQEPPTLPASVPVKPSPAKPPTEPEKSPAELLGAGNETLAAVMRRAGMEPIPLPDFGGDPRFAQRWFQAMFPPSRVPVSDLEWAILFAAVEAESRLRKMFKRLKVDEGKAMQEIKQGVQSP